MILLRTIDELREQVREGRRKAATVGFVPTMGAFHDGHLALMRRAHERCSMTVVSLFVNPTQFNESVDLDRYPRDEARDAALAERAGVDVLFAPSVEEIYPKGFVTAVGVTGLSEQLEGTVRGPTHFRGVTTVVAKLLNQVQPDDAFFGQKDAQQALLVRRMVRDLDFPVRVEVCPTIREPDGLAMSSRNVLLEPAERRRAPSLYRALLAVRDAVAAGERRAHRALAPGMGILASEGISTDYFAAVSTDTLASVTTIEQETLIAVAARFGTVRLIDNILLGPTETGG